jgi:Zn-dependent protease with chaperone function
MTLIASHIYASSWRSEVRGVRRSFWVLVAVAGVIEGYLVYAAIRSLHRVLPCWWSYVPHHSAPRANCGESVTIFGYNSWVPAIVILAFFIVTMIAAGWTLVVQVMRTRLALRRLARSETKSQELRDAEMLLGIRVLLVADARCFCCCAGLLWPRVTISSGMAQRLSSSELVAVLAHELEHAKRRDPARALAVRMAASALFYLPLARYLADQSLVAAELGADASAVSVAGRDALVGALLRVLGEVRPGLGGSTEMASLDALDLRIETLRSKTLPRVRPPLRVILASLAAIAVIWGLSAWLPAGTGVVITHHIAHILSLSAFTPNV